MGAVEHDSRSEEVAAIEDGHGIGDVVSEKVGAKPGMVFNPNDIAVARDGSGDALGTAGAPTTGGAGKLLDEYLAGESLLGVLRQHGGGKCERDQNEENLFHNSTINK